MSTWDCQEWMWEPGETESKENEEVCGWHGGEDLRGFLKWEDRNTDCETCFPLGHFPCPWPLTPSTPRPSPRRLSRPSLNLAISCPPFLTSFHVLCFYYHYPSSFPHLRFFSPLFYRLCPHQTIPPSELGKRKKSKKKKEKQWALASSSSPSCCCASYLPWLWMECDAVDPHASEYYAKVIGSHQSPTLQWCRKTAEEEVARRSQSSPPPNLLCILKCMNQAH